MRHLLVALLIVAGLAARAKVMMFSPTQLLAEAEVVAVIQVGKPGLTVTDPREAEVLEVVKGGVTRGARLKVDVTPRSSGGLMNLGVAGPCLMYLSKGPNGVYYTLGRGQGLRAVSYDDTLAVAELVGRYLGWDKLTLAERGQLIRASLHGPQPMRQFALDWMARDRWREFQTRDAADDDVLDGLLENLDVEDVTFRQSVVRVTAQLADVRPDLAAHLVDALADPDLQVRRAALPALERLANDGKLPANLAARSDDARIADVQAWWAKASADAKYARFTTPRWQMRRDVTLVATSVQDGWARATDLLPGLADARARIQARPALAHAMLEEAIERKAVDPTQRWMTGYRVYDVLALTAPHDPAGAQRVAGRTSTLCETALIICRADPILQHAGGPQVQALLDHIQALEAARQALAPYLAKG